MRNQKLKNLNKVVDVIEELKSYNQLTFWMKFQNWWRVRFKLRPIENLKLDPAREKVLKRRVARLQKKLHGQ